MGDLLEKIHEKYLDEVFGIFPLHRVISALVVLPLMVGVSTGKSGLTAIYMAMTPDIMFGSKAATLLQLPWAAWGLLIAVLTVGAHTAAAVRRGFVDSLGRSESKEEYLKRILESAKKIVAANKDTSNLEKSLKEKFVTRQKQLKVYAQLAEFFLSITTALLCFSVLWEVGDVGLILVVACMGFLSEYAAQRYYLAKVAPSMLLHGYISGAIAQLEDAYEL